MRRAHISVFASFELLSAVHRLDTEIGFTLVNADLIKKLTILNHPAVVLWFVGNELNLPSTGWACNVTRAEKLEGDACQFGGAELHDLYGRVNELCAQVVQRGKMCASPLADFSLPRSTNRTRPSRGTATRSTGGRARDGSVVQLEHGHPRRQHLPPAQVL